LIFNTAEKWPFFEFARPRRKTILMSGELYALVHDHWADEAK